MASKIIPMTAVKCTHRHVDMVKLLFGQYVFIAKSVNKTTYCACNTVQTTDSSTVFVQFHFHNALNQSMSYYFTVCWKGN